MANARFNGFKAKFLAIVIKQRQLAACLGEAAAEINQLPLGWTQRLYPPCLPNFTPASPKPQRTLAQLIYLSPLSSVYYPLFSP